MPWRINETGCIARSVGSRCALFRVCSRCPRHLQLPSTLRMLEIGEQTIELAFPSGGEVRGRTCFLLAKGQRQFLPHLTWVKCIRSAARRMISLCASRCPASSKGLRRCDIIVVPSQREAARGWSDREGLDEGRQGPRLGADRQRFNHGRLPRPLARLVAPRLR